MTAHLELQAQARTVNSPPGARILVVDEDHAIRRLLRSTLSREGYRVYDLQRVNEIFRVLQQHKPDILIIDPPVGERDSIALISKIRTKWSLLPILVLSEDRTEAFTVRILDAGADDYLAKPFGTGEFSARIRAALRHIVPPASIFRAGDLSVDLMRRVVRRNHQTIQLTPVEYDLLKMLIAHAGAIVTPNQFTLQLWGGNSPDLLHRLRTHMSNLRSKLEVDPSHPAYILTEPGTGYRLRLPD